MSSTGSLEDCVIKAREWGCGGVSLFPPPLSLGEKRRSLSRGEGRRGVGVRVEARNPGLWGVRLWCLLRG